ncbi:hypothetical protein [Parapedobacter sp. 10938]|uniref:hypothetical protein n=1 Tax=Parapedobacter flavus TaxID=3110225 RepID=UPI002DBA1359|nr:hypothetical protein [Parapedobacter sp. 10938]MEC3881175.1 hypothetical protein [Parapedobacter sp. 10938]
MKKAQIILISSVVLLVIFSIENSMSAILVEDGCTGTATTKRGYVFLDEGSTECSYCKNTGFISEPVFNSEHELIGYLYETEEVMGTANYVTCELSADTTSSCTQIDVYSGSLDCEPVFVPLPSN